MSVKLSGVEVVLKVVEAGQWSAVREKEKKMEEMTLGELLYRALVDAPMGTSAVSA